MHAQLKKKIGGLGWDEGQGRFLIDGFPRKMDQALKFEEDVRPFPFVTFDRSSFNMSLGLRIISRPFLHDH